MAKRHPFDVPVDGVPERYMTMEELMLAFNSCKVSDPEMARTMVEYACDCGHIPAKLAYASFLRTTPKLTMSQAERYQKAEELLLELYNLLDASASFVATVALELGALYADCLHRPIGALAMYLQGKRLGAHVEERDLQILQRKMEKTDVNHLGANCEDSFHLGRELMLSGSSFRLAELFLREAVDKSDALPEKKALCGVASLALADLYNEHRSESQTYRAEAAKMYTLAEKKGHPEYLSPKHSKSGVSYKTRAV